MKINELYFNFVLSINLFFNFFIARIKLEDENKFDTLVLKMVKLNNDPKIEKFSIIDHYNKKTLIYSIIKDIFELRYLYFFKEKRFKIRAKEILQENENLNDIIKILLFLICTQKLLSENDVLKRLVRFFNLKFQTLDLNMYISELDNQYIKEAKELEDLKVNELILESLHYSIHYYKIISVKLPTEKIISFNEDKIISVNNWLEGTLNLPEPKNFTIRSIFDKKVKNFQTTGFVPFKRKSR